MFLEQPAVLGRFQIRGFDLAAGFQLRGELIVQQFVGEASCLALYLLAFGGAEEVEVGTLGSFADF
jgi:hypothetical protein